MMPARLAAAAPIVRRPARLHHDLGAGRQRVDKRRELSTVQSPSFHDSACTIRRCHLEDILCQVHRDRRSIHVGLLFVQLVEPKPSLRHMMPRTNGEASKPIMAADEVPPANLQVTGWTSAPSRLKRWSQTAE